MNVHRINDEDPNQRRPNRVFQYDQLGPNGRRIPFLSPNRQRNSPRDENYWDMLQYTFCPKIKFLSLTTFILICNTLIFVLCITEGIARENTLLEIREEVLIKYGAMVPSFIKLNYHYHLLFTSVFISFNFLQFLINQLCITILVSHIEDAIGAFPATLIYIGSGAMGALFGAMVHCCIEQPFVETQAAIYGMLGALLAVFHFHIIHPSQFFILNWDALQPLEELRCFMLCILVMLTFLILLITLSSGRREATYDNFGSVGGLMGGFFLTLALAPPVIENGSYEKKCSIFGWTFTSIQTIICLLMIVLVHQA